MSFVPSFATQYSLETLDETSTLIPPSAKDIASVSAGSLQSIASADVKLKLSGLPSKVSMISVVHSVVAIHRLDDISNYADDSWYISFFCSEITVSQLSTFHQLFLEKMGKESQMVDKLLFYECVVPILTEDQKRGFGGKRFQTLFEKIDANKDGLVSWDDISLFILQGSGMNHKSHEISGSSSFFLPVDGKKTLSERASRKSHHKDVISCMHIISHLDVLVTAGHDGCIGVWKLKDLEMLQMIQVCPSNSTWITSITDVAWTSGPFDNVTTLCLATSSMRLYYAKVDEITSAFSTADPDTSCPCAYIFPGNENSTCMKGFRLFHAESDVIVPSGTGPKKYDDMIAIGCENGDILIMHSQVDRMKPSEEFKVSCHSDAISSIIWIAEMSILVAASHDSRISLHTFNLSRDGMSESKIFGAHSKAVNAIVYSNRDAIVASCGIERDILLWSPFTTTLLARLSGHSSSVFSLVVEARSSSLISLGSDRQVFVWSLTKYQCIFKQQLACKLRADVDIKAMVVAGTTLFLGTNSPLPWQMSESSFSETATSARITSHISPVIALLQATHFEQFITIHADGQAGTWAIATGSEIMNFSVCPDSAVASCAILDPKQRRLVVGADDGIIRVFNFCNGQPLHELTRTCSSLKLDAEKAEVCSICYVSRQMRICLAATYSDTSSIFFWPEYPSTYIMTAVSSLDVRGNFGLSTPEQVGYLHSAVPSFTANGFVMLMASGRLATISIDSGHTIAELHAPKVRTISGHREANSNQVLQTIFSLNDTAEEQSSIRLFVLAHKQSCLIAAESENRLHCWDFSRQTLKSSFEVPNRRFNILLSITCMDLSHDDGLLCVGDSHGLIHTYVNPFSILSTPRTPNWSFFAHSDSITVLKFVGTLDIIISSGSDSMTNLWRPDGKYFMFDVNNPATSISNPFAVSMQSSFSSSTASSLLQSSLPSSTLLTSSNALGALGCRNWKYETVLIAQGRFTRNPKPAIKASQFFLKKIRADSKMAEAAAKSDVDQDDNEKPRSQLLKSLKLQPPETPQEEREQNRMLLALATPRRGPPTTVSNVLPQLQSLRGPHCKIVVQPIAPDPYFNPAIGLHKNVCTPRRDAGRAFLPKDTFKDSILRQEAHNGNSSPLLKRTLKLVKNSALNLSNQSQIVCC